MERRERRQRRSTGEKAPLAQLPWKQPRRHFAPLRSSPTIRSRPSMASSISSRRSAWISSIPRLGRSFQGPERSSPTSACASAATSSRPASERRPRLPSCAQPGPVDPHRRQWIAFAPVGGPPNCSDADHGRRPGTFEDNANFIWLAQHFNCIHAGGGSADALDVHASVRHLRIGLNRVLLSDKVLFTASTGRAACSTAWRWRG